MIIMVNDQIFYDSGPVQLIVVCIHKSCPGWSPITLVTFRVTQHMTRACPPFNCIREARVYILDTLFLGFNTRRSLNAFTLLEFEDNAGILTSSTLSIGVWIGSP